MAETTYSEPVIFEEFPKLRGRIPWTPIGDFPTPADECRALAKALGAGSVFIKRDDLSNTQYGGNKVRKLEFLIAHAQKLHFKKLLTLGGIGSNHLLATTIHGKNHGLDTIGCVAPQPVDAHVKKNMLLYAHFGTELHLCPTAASVPATMLEIIATSTVKGEPPYYVPGGGSSAIGVIGYINAAFELKRQIRDGVLPEPDYIYVANGSSGTSSGLTAGCRAAGLKTKVMGVRVADWYMANKFTQAQLATFAAARLRAADSDFPFQVFMPQDMTLRSEFFGGEYGRHTNEGNEAVSLLQEHAGLKLEGVYTGKAAAAMVADARAGKLAGKNALYWHTFSSVDFSDIVNNQDYHDLPDAFHKYFEQPEDM
jgi:D-cysteine desulfhydrase